MSFTSYDFILLVKSMREAQKQYFKTRNKDTLRQSISLEAEVDSYIQEYLSDVH